MLIILAVSFLVLIMLGMPIAYAMGLSSFIALIVGGDVPLIVVPQRMFVAIDSFSMMAIPLFLLAGELMNSAGITRRIVRFSSTLVGHLRGGLAQVNILASILFSGVNGSAAADSATTGSMLIPAMVEEGYPPEFAGAVTATSSTLGAIKPPSIMMIIYGSITGQSIGALFLGGIVPGFMIAFSLMTVAYIISVKRGYKAREKAKLGEILSAFRESAVALVMPFIVIGGILSGIFTATEAGVVAVVYGLFAGIYLKELNPKKILRIFISAGKSTATIMFVLASAQILGWILARERLPQMVIAALLNISENPTIIMVLILIFLFLFGLFMDGTAAMIILVPVFVPILAQFGYDPTHFAVVVIMMLVISACTPPVGVLLFINCGIAKVSILQLSKAAIPFVAAMLLVILVVAFNPWIVTTLPRLLMG